MNAAPRDRTRPNATGYDRFPSDFALPCGPSRISMTRGNQRPGSMRRGVFAISGRVWHMPAGTCRNVPVTKKGGRKEDGNRQGGGTSMPVFESRWEGKKSLTKIRQCLEESFVIMISRRLVRAMKESAFSSAAGTRRLSCAECAENTRDSGCSLLEYRE